MSETMEESVQREIAKCNQRILVDSEIYSDCIILKFHDGYVIEICTLGWESVYSYKPKDKK